MTVMRTYLGCLSVVLSLVACGGTSDTNSQTGGGSSAGGAGSAAGGGAGHNNGAGASAGGAAGNTSGGSSSAGVGGRDGTSGSGVGGTLGNSGSGGNGGSGGSGGRTTVDARCPAQRPMGACSADDAGLACQYDNFSGCLCYPNVAGTFTPCQKVDPTCPSTAAPAPADGAGGASGKVAPPPLQVCSCAASTWSCHF